MDLGPLTAFCAGQGFALTPVQEEAFLEFGRALYETNAVMNLTRVPVEECVSRHFLDSVLVAPLLEVGWSVVDVGTGPGFPAWPLACARPDLMVTALDGSNKGLGFLRRHPLPNLRVVQARAEEWTERERFDAATGRALAPFPVQMEVCAPWVRKGGLLVPFRTPAELAQVEAFPAGRLGLRLERVVEVPLPETDVIRLFPVFVKVERTDRAFPRRWAEIKARPLAPL